MFEDLFNISKEATKEIFTKKGKDMFDNIKKSIDIPSPPPSRAGESPHKISGELENSFDIKYVGDNQIADISIISNQNDLIEWLEYGTEKMAPRPFLGPVQHKLDENLPQIAEDILKEISNKNK